jgi:phage gp36-like protein
MAQETMGLYFIKHGYVGINMNYCQLEDIEREFSGTPFNNSSKVTGDSVNEFISQESANIDGRIACRYQTPLTGSETESLKVLKRICIYRVCERIKPILGVKTQIQQITQVGQARLDSIETPNDDLDRIVDGDLRLVDAVSASTGEGVDFGETEEEIEPIFARDKVSW